MRIVCGFDEDFSAGPGTGERAGCAHVTRRFLARRGTGWQIPGTQHLLAVNAPLSLRSSMPPLSRAPLITCSSEYPAQSKHSSCRADFS